MKFKQHQCIEVHHQCGHFRMENRAQRGGRTMTKTKPHTPAELARLIRRAELAAAK